MIRITERPMNSVDPLVRRATALQQTVDIPDGAVHVSLQTAQEIGIAAADNVQLEQNEVTLQMPVQIDDRLPAKTVLIQAGHGPSGPWFGEIRIRKI